MKNISKIANEILRPFFGPTKQDLIDRIGIDWEKNPDGSFNVYKDTEIDEILIENGRFLINFNHVHGNFWCNYYRLTSLIGCPKIVDGSFYCCGNQLTNLEGSPKIVGRSFNCDNNKLTSLIGSPKIVNRDFSCYRNNLTDLEGCPEFVGKDFICTDNVKKFTKRYVKSVCDVKGEIIV